MSTAFYIASALDLVLYLYHFYIIKVSLSLLGKGTVINKYQALNEAEEDLFTADLESRWILELQIKSRYTLFIRK